MRWHDALNPVGMQRVALLAPVDQLRDLLVTVADQGCVELDELGDRSLGATKESGAAAALRRLGRSGQVTPLLGRRPDLPAWEQGGRADLLAGETELDARAADAVTRGRVAALAGWAPADAVQRLAPALAAVDASVLVLPAPRGVDPPTLLSERGPGRDFAGLVRTYATVPYRDVDPSLLAGIAYVVMFGMMFADAGHGALLLLAALAVRSRRWQRLERLAPYWRFLAGAGLASTVFGVLYGEFFGPTGVVPVIWLSPLENAVTLLLVAIAVGALLLAGAYALGSVNRFREGGWRRAVYAPSGLAGASLFLGLGMLAGGLYLHLTALTAAGAVVAVAALVVGYVGLLAAAGGGAAGASQAMVELVDLVVRLGSNLVSFARLAAFGLTHAALGLVVWQGATALAHRGVLGVTAAVLVFVVGNALTFALEGLVAGIQALRLEYYELFSRIFEGEGRPFRPWHVPLAPTEA
ncbi:V-type ATPase 116kDa subunit family protein [Cellulomonas sp. SG140]|uniref:V-type ATPase 116kDa subunit family protein n=1 Tax=Cellulomonas sp. SG140 TaxID=2976536 RepID=UPI0021E8FCD7|nr:V-type ATPase 116kDa subunit family protein [Cellulomonas sp. SG140]